MQNKINRYFGEVKTTVSETFSNAIEDEVPLQGAAIAFYTIFSVAPLIIIIVSVAGLILGEEQTSREVFSYIQHLAGQDIAESVRQFIAEPENKSSNILATILATATLLFGATTVITQLKNSLDTIWDITEPRISSIYQYLFNRLLALAIIMILAGLMISSLLIEGGLNFFVGIIDNFVPRFFLPLFQLASSLFSVLISIIFFTVLFKVLPDVNARWRDIFVGACVTTLLFLAGKYLIGFYLGNSSMQATYRAAGSFVIFLIWIYYNVQIVLLGAEFTQVYTKRYGKNLRASWNAELINFE